MTMKSKLAKEVNKMNVRLIKMGLRDQCRIELTNDHETGAEMFCIHALMEDGTEREFTGKNKKDLVLGLCKACGNDPDAQEIADTVKALRI